MLTRFHCAINFPFLHLLYTFFEKNKDINCIIPLNINYLIQIAFNYLTNRKEPIHNKKKCISPCIIQSVLI